MITTEELFNLIEEYLFAFPSTEDAIKHIFNNDINSYTKLDEKEIERRVNNNLIKYFKKQFKSNKLPTIIKKYIKSNKLKRLSKLDMQFLDNIIYKTEYEVTYEDLEKLLNIKQISNYLKVSAKEELELVVKLRQFIKLQEAAEEEKEESVEPTQEKSVEPTEEEYDGVNIEKIYERDSRRYKLLSREEERYYLKKYQEEDDKEAFDILIGSNQGLCKKIARRYEGRGLSKLDLIQEGNIGLIKCLEKFDLKRETKLSTYAMWWIDQSVQKAVKDKSKTIRVPVHVQDGQDKLNRVESAYMRKFGYEPTIEELAELSGFTKEKIKELKDSEFRMVSFDKKVQTDDDSGSTLGDFIKSEILTPEEILEEESEKELLNNYLERLAKDKNVGDGGRQEQIIRLRFGIELYNETTYELIRRAGFEVKDKYKLEDVGKIFGVTRERIRQLEAKAIKTLKKYGFSYKKELESNGKISVPEKGRTLVKNKRKYTRRKQKEKEE